jgi:protein-S-isoprenylcysteine O-methyltransferase Ste14
MKVAPVKVLIADELPRKELLAAGRYELTRRWLVPTTFLAAAAVTGAHAWHAVLIAGGRPDGRHVLLALHALLRTAVALVFAALTVGRAQPHRRSRDPLAFAVCAAALLAVAATSGPTQGTAPVLLALGDAVAVCGYVWMLVSLLALGRCFGVLPEARGLVQRGPYRFVRHPVYLGEITALAGLTLAAPAARNLALLGVLVAAQIARARFEERALTEALPDYASYAETTGRLFPRLRGRAIAAAGVDVSCPAVEAQADRLAPAWPARGSGEHLPSASAAS